MYPNQNGKKEVVLDNLYFIGRWQNHNELDKWSLAIWCFSNYAFWRRCICAALWRMDNCRISAFGSNYFSAPEKEFNRRN